jgi:hypothetical protein
MQLVHAHIAPCIAPCTAQDARLQTILAEEDPRADDDDQWEDHRQLHAIEEAIAALRAAPDAVDDEIDLAALLNEAT